MGSSGVAKPAIVINFLASLNMLSSACIDILIREVMCSPEVWHGKPVTRSEPMSGQSAAGKLFILAVLVALTAILAVACGGEASPTDSPASTAALVTAATPTPTPSPSPILGTTAEPADAATPTTSPESTPTPTQTPFPKPVAGLEANADAGPAPFTVVFTNLSENAGSYEWDFGDDTSSASGTADESLSHEYTTAGTYEITLTAFPLVEPGQSSVETVTITVVPGPLFELKIEPDALTATPTQEQSFTTIAVDQFGNQISGLSYVFSVAENAGEVDDTGQFTAGTIAGSYSGAVAVEAVQGSVTETAAVDITIEHGALDHILLTPETVQLGIGVEQNFSAVAVDAYDNPVTEAQTDWTINEAIGTIAEDGTLSVGTLAGTFEQSVKVVAWFGSATVEATASVTVNPGPPAALSVAPIEVAAGDTRQLQASVVDEYGNAIEGVEVTWSVPDGNAGSISSSGILTAGEVVGAFSNAIEANATIEGLTTGSSVNITPGPLAQVVIAPDPVSIGMEITQQFVAVGADLYGHRISGLAFNWSLEEGGGTINAGGLFTSGTTPGSYNKTVKATAVQSGLTASDTASVNVEPDRISFVSNRNNGQFDVYLMNMDGTNTRQVTNVSAFSAAWSSSGRRVLYYSPLSGGIVATNDDGTWPVLLVESTFGDLSELPRSPVMSPNGGKIALVIETVPRDATGALDFEHSVEIFF